MLDVGRFCPRNVVDWSGQLEPEDFGRAYSSLLLSTNSAENRSPLIYSDLVSIIF